MVNHPADFRIEPATERDVPLILRLIRGLADYERLNHAVVADEAMLRESLFGSNPAADVAIARLGANGVGMAIWFYNYSTFLGRRGLYLEDLFVLPEWRGRGIGRALLAHLAHVAMEKGCGRMEWAVLDWNESAIGFYRNLGAQATDQWTVYRVTGDALARLAAG